MMVVIAVPVAIVIMFIPVAFGVPAAVVFAPPAVKAVPATFALCAQLLAGVIGLRAVPPMTSSGLV